MRLHEIKQLIFDFTKATPPWRPFRHIAQLADEPVVETPSNSSPQPHPRGRDAALEEECKTLLIKLGMPTMTKKVQVRWNTRLRSSAGYASYPGWRIELNPKLREHEGQVQRTLLHELAHLVAYQRAGHTRIEPHGREWKQACADLGIGDEKARHHLPLPRNQVKTNFTYVCVSCGSVTHRVRKFRRHSACRNCCNRYNKGAYDPRFHFELVTERNAAKYASLIERAAADLANG
jgi:SprT protein